MFLRCCVWRCCAGVSVAILIMGSLSAPVAGQSTSKAEAALSKTDAVKNTVQEIINKSAPQFDDSDSTANLRALDALLEPAERPSVTWQANQHFAPPSTKTDPQDSGLAKIRVPAIHASARQVSSIDHAV